MATPKLSKERYEFLREKFEAASTALFAFEEALGPLDSLDRKSVYRVRVELGYVAQAILGERPM